MEGAIASTDASVKATLHVRTAEARVGFFLRKFREAKTECDDAEVTKMTSSNRFNNKWSSSFVVWPPALC